MDYIEEVVDLIRKRATKVDHVSNVVLRSLNTVDPTETLGIAVDDWTPIDWEMAGDGSQEPTTQRYSLTLQHVIKWGKQEEGERFHREVAKAIRLMLYRDHDFQVSLRSLYVQEDSRRERTLRFNVTDQRYASNDAGTSGFVFLSVTTIIIETETVTTF
jgi:hypothetical protein